MVLAIVWFVVCLASTAIARWKIQEDFSWRVWFTGLTVGVWFILLLQEIVK